MAHGAVATAYRQKRQCERAKAVYLELCGAVLTRLREAEIGQLPKVTWKGRDLYTLRCHGTSGKGPHDCNVPEGLLWSLMSLKHFLCVYHAGDR